MTTVKRTKKEVVGKLNDGFKAEFIKIGEEGEKVVRAREEFEIIHDEYTLNCKKFWGRVKETMNLRGEPHLHIDEGTFEVWAMPEEAGQGLPTFLKDLFKKENDP